jgi:hypothetical protein
MRDLFHVVWSQNGELVDDLEATCLRYRDSWTKGLVYCDMDGFAVLSDGTLILCDECGNYAYPSPDLFRVEWLSDEPGTR